MKEFGLYKFIGNPISDKALIHIEVFKPSLSRPFFWINNANRGLLSREANLKTEIFWSFASGGKYKLYYVRDEDGAIVHISYVIYRSFKFPFMKYGKDVQIGPCITDKRMRGKGYYPTVLNTICKSERADNYYILIQDINKPSIRGVEKAGFQKIGYLEQSSLLKVYREKDHMK